MIIFKLDELVPCLKDMETGDIYDTYCSEFQALRLPPIDNPYRFMMSDEVTARIREVYSYEWTDEII